MPKGVYIHKHKVHNGGRKPTGKPHCPRRKVISISAQPEQIQQLKQKAKEAKKNVSKLIFSNLEKLS